jgi:diguanylate cyclase (GGDEF)-like protein
VPQNRPLAQELRRAFTRFGALIVGGVFVTALAYGVSSAWLMPESERSRLGARAESSAYGAMIDEENGLRGYLMTRDVSFLEAFTSGEARLGEANQVMSTNIGPDVALGAAMIRMRVAQERWQARWARLASDTRPDAPAPSMSEGKALFDAYRTEHAAFAEALNQRSDLLSQREGRMIAARSLLDLVTFVAVLILGVRQHRALRDAIVAPVAALLRHVRRIRDGELLTTADRGGPREISELAEGLDEMVRGLAAARGLAASRDEALRDHSVQLRRILEASREFSESLNLAYVVGAVRESTALVGGYEQVIVWLMDDEQKRLVNADQGADAPPGTLVEVGEGLAGRAAKSGRITFEAPGGQVRFSDGDEGSVRATAIPLIVGARVVGALEARHVEAKAMTRQSIEVLEMLATHAATAIESARLHEVIEERSQMDALTRLFNRRRLTEDLDAECRRCVRYGRPLAFVMLDVDHFKAFNDAHGHPEADTALQALAEVISGCVRTTDTAYRYGGEEFCVLLRETSAKDAMTFAERVRLRIEQRFASGPAAGITASFGVAEFSKETPTPRQLVEAADAAMYESKRAGRNRVVQQGPRPSNGELLHLS